jgi:hypothetical protein
MSVCLPVRCSMCWGMWLCCKDGKDRICVDAIEPCRVRAPWREWATAGPNLLGVESRMLLSPREPHPII